MLNLGEIGGIAGGGAALVVGVSMVAIARRRRRLDRALVNADSATRLAALDVVTKRGLSGHLNVLVERALVEDDPHVRAGLVRVLLHAEWEPGADRRLLQLRAWAARSVAEPAIPVGSSPLRQASVADPSRADIEHESDRVPDEVGAATNEKPLQDHLTDTALDNRWFSELLTSDASGAPETAIDSPPTVSIARTEEKWNGGRLHGVSTGSSRGTIPIAKAEQNAIQVLREAGYRLATASDLSEPGTVGIDTADGTGSSPAADDLQLLTELCVKRVVTVTIMEEAIRRMRVENSGLEALLARLNESR
jgi:hypothetical protein